MKAGEDIDCVAMSKASSLQARVFLYLRRSDYDIKLVNTDGFTRAMSQLKWSTSSASGSTIIDLFKGPITDLLRLVACPKSYLIDREKGTHHIYYKWKHPICDISKHILGTTNSKWKEPIHDKGDNIL
ncbi:La-related protein 6 [Hordeum vulgare]|nr:La-related protein 6 [Hordeum vulgare]